MANTYTWAVNSMSTLPNVPNQPEYVVLVNATLTGFNSDTPSITGSISTTISLQVNPNSPNFVPYSSLTEEQVIAWVEENLTTQSITVMKLAIDSQIDSIVTPPVFPVVQPLPWKS